MWLRILARLLLLAFVLTKLPGVAGAQEPPSPETQNSATPSTLVPDLTPGPDGKLSADQMHRLFQVVAEKDLQNQKQERDYTYIAREVQNKLDKAGKTKSTEVRTYDILEIYGEPVQRLIAKDDKPLDPKDAAKEDEKIQKIIDKRKNESEKDRQKREEKQAKEREDDRKFVREIADAYDFTLLGTQLLGGREAWVFQGEPRPGFQPHMKESKFLSKFHGRVWIDKADLQMSKLDVNAIDDVSVGWVLARIHKGAHFMIEQTRVNNEVWLPQYLSFNLDARLALVKGLKVDGEETFRDYKKFRTSSKIVGMSEVQEHQ